MSDDLNDILNEAIPRWAKLTGTKLGTNKYTFHMGSQSEFQEYDLKKYIDDLNEARALDMTGTTAILLLRGLFEDYVKERSFGAHALLYEPAKVEATLVKLREFHALVHQPACDEAATAFKESLRSAALHYKYDLGKLKEHLADERTLGVLRLASLRSCERLDVHQFAQGKPDPNPLQYNREIFEFSNINSFVAALHKQWVSGITLALVRDSHEDRGVYMAYFVLGLRNGENITVLTDYEEGAHPDYHYMTRRPERQLEARARLHWFPYRLLDEDPVKRAKSKTALVPLDAKAVAVDEVPTLEPSEFVWLAQLFELVAKKYGGDFKTEELSYTGQMVVEPHALIESTNALVVAGQYKPLVLPKLTSETTTREAADNEPTVGFNAWMEERYGNRVPDVLYDVVGERRALEVGKEVTKLIPGKVDEEDLPERRREPGVMGWSTDWRKLALVPQALDPTYFGTKKQIERNRAWAARSNKIQAVQKFAVAEFVAKQALILRWYRARVEKNLPFLLERLAHGELVAPTARWTSTKGGGHDSFPEAEREKLHWSKGNILRRSVGKRWWHAFPGDGFKGVHFGEWSDALRNVQCFKTGLNATIFGVISPDNPRALALLCGIPEKKLPWPLQHWHTFEPYTGNSILRRIDPQDSRLDNPWRHLELRITIALCKREYNRLLKEHGLEAKETG